MTVSAPMEEILIDNRDVGEGGVRAAYRFTDIYGQAYWTEFLDL